MSVIVPLYNAQKTIGDLLDSIYRCNYNNLEIIVVDDGSTDNGPNLVQTLYPRVTLVRNDRNRGKSWSLNRGISRSSGDLLIITDPDLYFDPYLLSAWATAMARNPRLGVGGCFVYYKDKPKTLGHAGAKMEYRRVLIRRMLENTPLAHSNEFYEESSNWVFDDLYVLRKEAFDSVGTYDYLDFPTILEEADLQTRISKTGYTKAIIPGARALHAIPSDPWQQLRRYSKYKIEFLCRNRFILFRKLGLLSVAGSFALVIRLSAYYTFVALIQPVSLHDRLLLIKAMGLGIIRGLLDHVEMQ